MNEALPRKEGALWAVGAPVSWRKKRGLNPPGGALTPLPVPPSPSCIPAQGVNP